MRKAKCKLSAKERLEQELTQLRRSCARLRYERIKREADLEEAKATISRAGEVRAELDRNHMELQSVRQTLGHVNEELKRRQEDLEPYQTRICNNCKFCGRPGMSSTLECRLHPPVGVERGEDARWPRLNTGSEWCGKFEAR